MQGREVCSQTRKKACDAPAIKSSRPKKPVLRNLNKIFSDSSPEDDGADEINICDDSADEINICDDSADEINICDDGADEINICDDSADEDTEWEEEKCLFCGDVGAENEMWFRCAVCGLWAHSLCSVWDSPKE
jgi:hypothetical protein